MTKQELKEKYNFESNFVRLMVELKLYNLFNKTFILNLTEKTEYGWKGYIQLEYGLSFADIEKNKAIINENLKCLWIMKTKQFEDKAQVQIVTEPMNSKMPYEKQEIKPNEMYLGVNFSKKPIIINVNEFCMFLLAGAVGSGKTRFLYQMLLSWILNCKCNEVELYISDIAKNEYNCFQYCKHVKFYASELEDLYKMMLYIDHKIEKRKWAISDLRNKGLATNIDEYNRVNKDSKMSYVYVLTDEFSVIVPDKTDTEEEKMMKQTILDIQKKISKLGRSLGIFCINCTQKTVKDELPSIIRNMSAVRLSFRANDMISSEVIMGDHSAVGLENRYAVYSLNGGSNQDYLYSPYITLEKIKELIKPFEDKKHQKVNVNEFVPSKTPQEPSKITRVKDKSISNQQVQKVCVEKKPNFPTMIDSRKGEFIDR